MVFFVFRSVYLKITANSTLVLVTIPYDFFITDIANMLYISKSFVIKIINLYEKWACVTNSVKGIPGRKKLFSRRDMCILQSLVKDKVDWYLDELVYEMENLTGKRASIS